MVPDLQVAHLQILLQFPLPPGTEEGCVLLGQAVSTCTVKRTEVKGKIRGAWELDSCLSFVHSPPQCPGSTLGDALAVVPRVHFP